MSFTNSIKQSIEILKLNKKAIEKVAKDSKATTAGIIILIIGGFIAGIASKKWSLLVISPILSLVFSFIGIGILHLIAKLFKGKAEFIELYRALTHAGILNWLSVFNIVPTLNIIIGIITGIWGIIINFVIIKRLYKLSTARTIFVIIIPLIFFMLLAIIVGVVFVALNPEMLASLQ